jgi:hypothetical protein
VVVVGASSAPTDDVHVAATTKQQLDHVEANITFCYILLCGLSFL